MFVAFVRHALAASIVIVCAAGPVCGSEPRATNRLFIYAGFETLPVTLFPSVLPKRDIDSSHGFCVLTDIEAYFLLDRGEETTPNYPPKRNAAVFGRPLRVAYRTDPPTDCSVLVYPSLSDDGKLIRLSIESPKGSTFTLKGKIDVRLAPTNVVYVQNS